MSERFLLARRSSGHDHAVVFEPDRLRIEGGFALRRRIPYRRVRGLERAASWLWLGVGLVPVALGGRDVPAPRLTAVERELRERIAALPAGAQQIARLDRRGQSVRRVPWLSVGLVMAGSLALLPGAAEPRAVAASLLLWLAFGLVVEGWLGRGPALASGAAGVLAATGFGATNEVWAIAPQLVSGAWIGLLGFARTLREADLPVLTRSAIDGAALVAVGFFALVLASGASPWLVLAAALGGFASGALVLRRPAPAP